MCRALACNDLLAILKSMHVKTDPRFSIFFIFLLGLSGCSSTTYNLRSTPEPATVFIGVQGRQNSVEMGKTPLALKYSDLTSKLALEPAGSDVLKVTFKKQDHKDYEILLPAARWTTSSVDVKAILEPITSESRLASQMVQDLANSQKFAQGREYEKAHIAVDRVLAIDSKMSSALYLKASINFLEKKYPESLAGFEKVLAIDPQNQDALNMINRTKKLIGQN